jgi:hypothetical protein
MADDKDPVSSSESSRRAFIQRMVAAGFAGPVIGSFSFSELAAASGPRHTFPNQYHPNQPPPPPPHDDDGDDDHGDDDHGDQHGGDHGDHHDKHHDHHH